MANQWISSLCGCCIVWCAAVASPVGEASQTNFLFDRVISWADGSAERVQVGRDGYFRLDGRKVRLVGVDIGTTGFSNAYFKADSLAIIDKELACLQKAGIRVIHANFGYAGYRKEAECYRPLLDRLSQHKMLVFPLLSGKWLPHFGDLSQPDFPIGGSDSLSQWTARWCAIMTNYPNVVAVAAENELDIPLKLPAVPVPQSYTAANTAAYMRLLTSDIRSRLAVPVVTKLVGEVNANWPWRPDIKEAVLPFSDFPCLDLYYPTVPELNRHLDAVLDWLKARGHRTNGFWVGEANAGKGNAPRSADFHSGYLESMFERGAALVCLWVANRVKEPSSAFFDADGNPREALVKLAGEIRRLQVPGEGPESVPVN